MTLSDLKYAVSSYYEENLTVGQVLTQRMVNSFAKTLKDLIDKNLLQDSLPAVMGMLSTHFSKDFISSRQPNIEPVSDEVIDRVRAYLKDELIGTELVAVMRSSNHPEDDYLYAVIGKKELDGKETFSCWTSWNDDREVLNYGHYGLPSYESALSIIKENFNDITDEIEKYGPEQTIYKVSDRDLLYDQKLFMSMDMTKSIVNVIFSSEELSQLAAIMCAPGYTKTHVPSNDIVYGGMFEGKGLTEQELFDLIDKRAAGEDISEDFVHGMIDFRCEHIVWLKASRDDMNYRFPDYDPQNIPSEFKTKVRPNVNEGYTVSYMGCEKNITYREMYEKCMNILRDKLATEEYTKERAGEIKDIGISFEDPAIQISGRGR